MNIEEKLTFRTPDTHGLVPDMGQIGVRLKHSGNGKTYITSGFVWMGATDEWGFVAYEDGVSDFVEIVRPLGHITGNRADGTKRYEPVE